MASLPQLQPVQIQQPDIPNALAAHYKLQEMQQAQDTRNALMQAGPGLVSNDPTQFKNSLMTIAGVDPQTALQLQASRVQQQKAAQDLQWDQLSKAGQAYGAIADLPDDQIIPAAQQAIALIKSRGADVSQIEPLLASGDPNKIRQFATLAAKVSMSRAQQLQQINHTDDETDKANTLAETVRHNKASEGIAAQRAASDDASALSPDAVDIYGSVALTNGGSLPSFGMGGAKQKVAISNNMAAKAKAQGITGEDIATGAASFKANSQALAQVTKMQTAIGSYEQTASQNADIALGLMQKGAGPTGSPVVDRWIRAGGKSIAGDPDVSKFDTALNTFKNEYAKVMSGGYGAAGTSDSMRHEADQLISPNMSREQILGNIQVMKQDMANRTKALNDYRSNLVQHIHSGASSIYQPVTGGSASPAQMTQPQASPGQAGKYPVMQSPADAMRLPPGTLFYTPDGRLKVR